jgi:membrane-associated phospholipid phosphatase
VHSLLVGASPRTRLRVLGAVGACAAVVLALGIGVLVDLDPQVRLDAAVSRALYSGDDRSAGLDRLLHVLTTPGVMWFRLAVFAPVVIWLAVRRRWRPLVWVVPAILLVGPLTLGLKELIGRSRPAFESGGLSYGGLSYPSGHSSGIATLVTVGLVLAWPRLGPVARKTALVAGVALVVLVGLTRMWLGLHFLSDVVGGWALGVGWSLGVALLLGGLPGGPSALPAREDRP